MTLTVSALALTCFILLAVGYVLFLVLGRVERLVPIVTDAWPILYTETVIVGVAAGVFWLGGWVLAIALIAHAVRTAFEAASVANRRHHLAHPLLIGGGFGLLCIIAAFLPIYVICIAAPGVAALLITLIRRNNRQPNSAMRVTLDLALFPMLPLLVFTAAGLQGGYGVWLLAAFILTETFDSYASFGGKLFGKRKAFPTLSPNKTIEGLAIGAGMLMVTAAIVGAILAGLPVLASAAVALLAGVFTVAGDLTASRLKRLSGVKDYPQVMPRQGGLLDITDAWVTNGAGLVCVAVIFGL